MAAFTKNTIFVKIWEKLRQNGGKIAFWPWFSPKLTNFRNFCKPCHFFNIYRSVSCKSLDNRDLSGKNDEWWLKISFKDFLIIFSFVDFFSEYVTLFNRQCEKSLNFQIWLNNGSRPTRFHMNDTYNIRVGALWST